MYLSGIIYSVNHINNYLLDVYSISMNMSSPFLSTEDTDEEDIQGPYSYGNHVTVAGERK